METKSEYTIEELEAQYKQTEEKQRILKAEIEQKIREKERIEAAKLAEEKDCRKKELDDALQKYKTLLKAYMKDYGVYSYTSDDDIFNLFNSKFWNQII